MVSEICQVSCDTYLPSALKSEACSYLFHVICTTSFSMSSASPFSRGSAIMVILFLVRKERRNEAGQQDQHSKKWVTKGTAKAVMSVKATGAQQSQKGLFSVFFHLNLLLFKKSKVWGNILKQSYYIERKSGNCDSQPEIQSLRAKDSTVACPKP